MSRAFGAYQLGESLAQLPVGELVAATHPARSEPLAILLLDARLSSDHRFRGLVRLELARVGGLRQPGIARMIEVSEQSGALAVVYERPADSVSLADWQASHDDMDQDAALRLVRRLAEALDAAHGRRIVHGLLGPNAVLIGQDRSLAIVGFGLLAAVEEAGQREAVLEGADYDYLAPEQQSATGDSRSKAAVSSADSYALAVLTERLLGADAASARSALARQASPDPTQRYSNCMAFVAALMEQAGPAASPPSPLTGSQRPPSSPPPAFSLALQAPTPPAQAMLSSPPEDPLPATPSPGATVEPSPPVTPPIDVSPMVPDREPASPSASPSPSDTPASGVPLAASGPGPAAAPPFATPAYASPPPAYAAPVPPGPTGPPSWRGGPASAPSITRLPPTTAMLTCKQEAERTDILTTGVLAITDRVEMLDRLVDRYAPEGRIGPAPLGAVVAGVLFLLLLLLRQPAGAAIIVALAMGVYMLPPLLKKITANEQPRLEAIRATGPVSIIVREIAPRWDTYELEIGDGAPLTLTPSGYRRLLTLGKPVIVERQGPHGAEQHTVAHDLPTMTVTYLLPGRLLLDVRDAAGTVLHRHPEYAGEPGDRATLAPSADTEKVRTGRPPFAEQPDAVPAWRQTARGHRMVQQIPPPLVGELRAAFKSAAIKAGLATGVPAAILLVSMVSGDFGFFALFIAIAIFGFVGAGLVMRALNLWRAQQSNAIVRVAAQLRVRLVERSGSKGSKSQHYYLLLDDGKELKIEQALFDRLANLGRPLDLGARPGFWESLTQSEEVRRVSEVDGLTVTYEPSADLLLEVVDEAGTAIYRDSAVSPQALSGPPPREAPSAS